MTDSGVDAFLLFLESIRRSSRCCLHVMLSVQTAAFFAAFVAVAVAVPVQRSSPSIPKHALSAIHTMIYHQPSRSLNFSRSASATTSQIPPRFLAAARPSKSEPVDEAPVILASGKNASQSPSTTEPAKTLITKVNRANAFSSRVSRTATGKDEAKLRFLRTEASEGRQDDGTARARRGSQLALLLAHMKPDVAARQQIDGLGGGEGRLDSVSRAGLTLDPCVSSLDCAGERACFFYTDDEDIEICNTQIDCFCAVVPLQECASSLDCVTGETCLSGSESSFCVSTSYAASTETPEVTDEASGSEGGPSDSSVSTSGDGLTLAPCFEDSDCNDPRACLDDDNLSCNGSAGCLCFPEQLKSCDSPDSCFAGEVCVVPAGVDPVCVSPVAAETVVENGGSIITDGSESTGTSDGDVGDRPPPPEQEGQPPATEPESEPESESAEESDGNDGQVQAPTVVNDDGLNTNPEDNSSDEGVCVDAKALAHMPTSDLVFEQHPKARVLCDMRSSCATPGHLVVFRGEPMMMKSYCKLTTCSERVMEVNSPRYSRQLLISSNTDELKFTAFAARYETRGEETLMSMAVRVGL